MRSLARRFARLLGDSLGDSLSRRCAILKLRFPGSGLSRAYHLLPTEIMTVLSHTSAIEAIGKCRRRVRDADEVRSMPV